MKKRIAFILLFAVTGCESLNRIVGFNLDDPMDALMPKEVLIVGIPAQSNGLGRGENTEYPDHPRVTITRDLRTGPFYYAASLFADAHPSLHITLVQCGEGGVGIDRWMPGGDRYERCVQETNALRATGATVIALFGYHGEANARDNLTFDPLWPRKFEMLIAAFRSATNSPAPLVWARLGQLNSPFQAYQDNWARFKANQLTVFIPNSRMIETEDQPVLDDVHHGYEANRVIGERFFNAL